MSKLSEIEHLILDMDGVLWHGNTPVPGLPQFFERLKKIGVTWVFATNNSGKARQQYVEKFAGMGVAINPSQLMTSAIATAHYIADQFPAGSKMYILGGDGLYESLAEVGMQILDRSDYHTPADAVVGGLNPAMTYEDLSVATLQIRNHNATFIGSNADSTYPTERGLVPGAGSMLSLITTATDVEPTVVGKPFPIMFQQGVKLFGDGATLQNTAMVGDRLNTDIMGAVNAGMRSILVMSGITQPADLDSSDVQPEFIFDDITALVSALEEQHG
ncbi:MAG: HAD-IIA family hydrolase [Chloroflexota bacterium]